MWQMVKSCDRSQRRLAVYLIIIVVLEVYAITKIIKHEHLAAKADKISGKSKADQIGGKGASVSAAVALKSIDVGLKNNTSVLLEPEVSMAPKSKHCGQGSAHFSLGNDMGAKVSSYQNDFSVSSMKVYVQRVKRALPTGAEILPYVDQSSEKQKWLSSTMRDFTSFGSDARTKAYQTSRRGFEEAKQAQCTNMGLLKDNFTTVLSSYNKDFRQPGASYPGTPERMNLTKAGLNIFDKREKISEASDAFQWPSQDRIKVPLFLQTKERL